MNRQSTFRRGRSTLWVLRTAIVLAAVSLLFDTARNALAYLPPGLPPTSQNNPPSNPWDRGEPDSVGQCTSPLDCDDDNACTTDTCVSNECQHVTLPGCVPCNDGQACPPVDLVVVMDSSGSMKDEAAALCANIEDVVSVLVANGIEVNTTILGVSETPGGAFECLTNSVTNLLGATIPGNAASCTFPSGPFPDESWGPGAAIVADRFPWTQGSIRVVSPIGDEAPCNGSFPGGCQDPGQDRDTVDNLIIVAQNRDVVVSPILGGGTDSCVFSMAQEVAVATGGTVFQSSTPSSDIAQAIIQLVGQACAAAGECNDMNACTTGDACSNGVCTGTQIPGCTSCSAVEDCDDNFGCTLDFCVGGVCAYQDLNTIACTSDAQCFGAGCNTSLGHCECLESTSLCLNDLNGTLPGEGCYADNEVITVNVEVGPTNSILAGGQFAIDYDPETLEFISADPGNLFDPSSVFSVEIFETVNESQGRVFYAVGIDILQGGAQGPAVMATLKFRAIGVCDSDELCFLDENPAHTLLTDIVGHPVAYEPCCTGPITVDAGAPRFLNCPDDSIVNVLPGEVTAVVTWPTVIAADECEGAIEHFCTASHSGGLPVGDLIANGGTFPIGITTFTCNTVDACELTASCSWTVEVTNNTLLDLEVQLSPTVVDGPLSRCITLELFSSCSEPSVIVETMLDFGMPYNLPGRVRRLNLQVPPGAYQCMTARDARHTLRATAEMSLVQNAKYEAHFENDPHFGGNWLAGGNLDENGSIDVIDFGYFMSEFLSQTTAGTGCDMEGIHADVNGDGLVDQIDGMFIVANYGLTEAPGCCDQEGIAGAASATTDLSIRELHQRGLSRLRVADLNHDGRLNTADMQLFTSGLGPKLERLRPRK